jgi:uncharacterized membrane protein
MSQIVDVEVAREKGKVGFGVRDPKVIRNVAAAGYLLFFIPLIFAWKSEFARFHANQALFFNVFALAVYGFSFIPIVGGLSFFGYLLGIVLFGYGIFNALTGREARLFIIGGIDVIK